MTVSYDFYKTVYLGTMPETDFTRLSGKAMAYLDNLSQHRIVDTLPDSVLRQVQLACCAICDEYRFTEQGGEVAAVTNDGYQIQYATGTVSSKTPAQRVYSAAVLYLAGTDLLYRGV